jgi:hypothetical protein
VREEGSHRAAVFPKIGFFLGPRYTNCVLRLALPRGGEFLGRIVGSCGNGTVIAVTRSRGSRESINKGGAVRSRKGFSCTSPTTVLWTAARCAIEAKCRVWNASEPLVWYHVQE